MLIKLRRGQLGHHRTESGYIQETMIAKTTAEPAPIIRQILAQTAQNDFVEMWVTCIGVTDYKSCCAFSNSLDEGSHLSRPQSTVQTNAATNIKEASRKIFTFIWNYYKIC